MEQLLQQIEAIKKEIAEATASGQAEVEQYRIKYLGTKGLGNEKCTQ
jgi:phenylalanyl-tRNA synthetase alpha chain